jgi:Arc/MetJ-type ribon-helix-helix transcriptional regulator
MIEADMEAACPSSFSFAAALLPICIICYFPESGSFRERFPLPTSHLIKGLISPDLEFPGRVPYDGRRTLIFVRSTMTITLKPDTERLINEELKSGQYKDAEEVIQRALQTLHAAHQAPPTQVHECQEAAARIRELRQGVTLGGLSIKDLIHAGHKY